jgi:ABC-type polysaccharide/polyol phosphate export permease
MTRIVLQGWQLFWMTESRRYRSAFLGFLWILAAPLVAMLPLVVVGAAISSEVGTQTDLPYPVYALSGVMLWHVFWSGAGGLLGAFRRVRKHARRMQIDPFAPVARTAVETVGRSVVAFAALLALVAVTGTPVGPGIWLFPLPALVAFAAGMCVGLPLVLANSIYTDFRFAQGFLHQAIFWSLPVVLVPPAGTLPAAVVAWNPLTPCFALWRGLIAGRDTPEAMPLLALAAVIAVVLFAVGGLFRRRYWDVLDDAP